jgi:hypothetical protein
VTHELQKKCPSHGIKCLRIVNFEQNCGTPKIIMNCSSFNERTLVRPNHVMHMGRQAEGQSLGNQFVDAVNEVDRLKVLHLLCISLFMPQCHVSLVN